MQVGRYHVVGHLATGGMAEVLLGKIFGPSGFEQPVVLKRILPHLASEPMFRTMFVDEARMVARIRHPNVVRVHELVEEEDELFLIMEYLEGETAAGVQRRSRAKGQDLDPGSATYIVAQACAGIHAAHEATDLEGRPHGLIHRDISPQNIFVTYGGQVKVIDFGIAKAADRVGRASLGGIKGKFSYMSPEQTRGEDLDRRSDVFSLGIVLYELSTGRRLFVRSNVNKTIAAICEDEISPPGKWVRDYPPELERVCMKALARDPDQRYPTAAAMRRDLLEVLRDIQPSPAPEEDLALRMRELFPDRIQEKNALLRTVRAGAEPDHLPAPEADLDVDLPTVIESPQASRGHDPGRKRRFQIAVGVSAAAAVGAFAYQVTHLPEPEEVESTEPPENAPKRVDLTIDSEPSGAEVWIESRKLGKTPIELESPSSGETFEVELRKEGYAPKKVKIVPDANTDLVVELVPSGEG